MNLKLLKYIEELANARRESEKQTFYDKLLMYWRSCITTEKRNITKYLEVLQPSEQLNWPLLEMDKDIWLRSENEYSFWPLLGRIQAHGLNDLIVKTQIMRNKNNTLDIWLAPALITELGSLPDKVILKVLLEALEVAEKDIELVLKDLKDTDFLWLEFSENQAKHNYQDFDYHDLPPCLQLYLDNLLAAADRGNITKITLENLKYFELLQETSWTNIELIRISNYIMIKFLYYLAVDSTREFTPLKCLKDLRHKFDLALNYLYYEKSFKHEQFRYRKPLIQMLYKIQNTMIKLLEEENHLKLSELQIEKLIRKLEAVKVNIGNLPDNYYNNNKSVESFYQSIPLLSADNYYKNHLNLLKHRFTISLLYPQNQSHFTVTDNFHSTLSSPFYTAQQNMIVIPFDSLQLPLYHYNLTALQQFSLLGFVLAHELTHVIDTSGLQYDHNDLITSNNEDILMNISFSEALWCTLNQEPTEEIDERIADLFAVRVAYRSYLDYYAEDQYQGWERDFFRELAQFFCNKGELVFIGHDADSIRLLQILKNFDPFGQAYDCPLESPMNPEHKCRLY
ncbi:membrane metallo-endopeptidase-like 1 [Cochliomyia hominivorax]